MEILILFLTLMKSILSCLFFCHKEGEMNFSLCQESWSWPNVAPAILEPCHLRSGIVPGPVWQCPAGWRWRVVRKWLDTNSTIGHRPSMWQHAQWLPRGNSPKPQYHREDDFLIVPATGKMRHLIFFLPPHKKRLLTLYTTTCVCVYSGGEQGWGEVKLYKPWIL